MWGTIAWLWESIMEGSGKKVSIIIPNYNGIESLKRLLPSIVNQTYVDFEVIIIDDFSPDRPAVDYIRTFIKDHKNMRLIENTENLGFTKTCNKGFGLANGDYICLLTNDTEVKSNFVKRNIEILDSDSSIGVLSSIIIDGDGNNWFTGGYFRAGLYVIMKDDFTGVRSLDWVAGTAPFYRKEVFDKVGLLNEDFVMYHEDIDFCLRVINETDYKVSMFAEKLVIHYVKSVDPRLPNVFRRERDLLYYLGLKRRLSEAVQTTPDRANYYGTRNHILLVRRHCPKYIPKVLLYNFFIFIKSSIIACLDMRVIWFLFLPHIFPLFIRGTLSGLTFKQGS